MSGDRPDPMPLERERVTRLKQQIAQRTYRVDSEAVAQEIVFKLRVINSTRRALLADPPDGAAARRPTSAR